MRSIAISRHSTDEIQSVRLARPSDSVNHHAFNFISEVRSNGNGSTAICIQYDGCASIFHCLNCYRRCLKNHMYSAIFRSGIIIAIIACINRTKA